MGREKNRKNVAQWRRTRSCAIIRNLGIVLGAPTGPQSDVSLSFDRILDPAEPWNATIFCCCGAGGYEMRQFSVVAVPRLTNDGYRQLGKPRYAATTTHPGLRGLLWRPCQELRKIGG